MYFQTIFKEIFTTKTFFNLKRSLKLYVDILFYYSENKTTLKSKYELNIKDYFGIIFMRNVYIYWFTVLCKVTSYLFHNIKPLKCYSILSKKKKISVHKIFIEFLRTFTEFINNHAGCHDIDKYLSIKLLIH